MDVPETVPPYFPIDQYDVEPCPCTQRLLQLPPGATAQVVVRQMRNGMTTLVPCGFVRANPARTGLQLVVLPYNYPQLLGFIGTDRIKG